MKKFTFLPFLLMAGCGAFASIDEWGYGIGINTTEISEGYFSSLHVRFYPSSRMASVGMDWSRPLILGSITFAPTAGLEGLRRERDGNGYWYGIGGLLGMEIIPSGMLVGSRNAREGDFLWLYIRPYGAFGYDFVARKMYRRYGVEAGFRVRMVYSW